MWKKSHEEHKMYEKKDIKFTFINGLKLENVLIFLFLGVGGSLRSETFVGWIYQNYVHSHEFRCLVLQETYRASLRHPVHVSLLCCFDGQLQGNVIDDDWLQKHLLLSGSTKGVLEEAFLLFTVRFRHRLILCSPH